MGKVILDMAVSLDGYICGPNYEYWGVYDWFFAPSTGSDDLNQQVVAQSVADFAVIIMGKRTFEGGNEEEGFDDTPYHATHIVITHRAPENFTAPEKNTFIFVTDGIHSALQQAQVIAGEKHIAIGGGASIAQQFLAAGLVDEITLHVIPVLFGAGIRLFDNIGTEHYLLEVIGVIQGVGVNHLSYRVIKK